MNKYAAESHPELDTVVSLCPSYESRLDALSWEQRHNIALAIEANHCEWYNDTHAGKPTVFETENETILAAAEGQLTAEESENH